MRYGIVLFVLTLLVSCNKEEKYLDDLGNYLPKDGEIPDVPANQVILVSNNQISLVNPGTYDNTILKDIITSDQGFEGKIAIAFENSDMNAMNIGVLDPNTENLLACQIFDKVDNLLDIHYSSSDENIAFLHHSYLLFDRTGLTSIQFLGSYFDENWSRSAQSIMDNLPDQSSETGSINYNSRMTGDINETFNITYANTRNSSSIGTVVNVKYDKNGNFICYNEIDDTPTPNVESISDTEVSQNNDEVLICTRNNFHVTDCSNKNTSEHQGDEEFVHSNNPIKFTYRVRTSFGNKQVILNQVNNLTKELNVIELSLPSSSDFINYVYQDEFDRFIVVGRKRFDGELRVNIEVFDQNGILSPYNTLTINSLESLIPTRMYKIEQVVPNYNEYVVLTLSDRKKINLIKFRVRNL